MIVYLDFAQLVDLQRAGATDRERFISGWRDVGAELAVSLHHLQEAAQLADQEGLKEWFKVLRLFDRVRCAFASSATLLSFESQVQLLTLLGYSVDIQRSALDTLFPMAVCGDIEAHAKPMVAAFRQMRSLHSLEAEAHELSKRAGQRTPGKHIRREIRSEMLDNLDLSRLIEDAAIDPLQPETRFLKPLLEQTKSELRAAGTIRGALERLYDLTNVSVRDKIADEDLSAAAVFFNTGREQVEAVAHLTGQPILLVTAQTTNLDPYAAPGFSLQLAVQRGLRMHPRLEEPGNQIDIAHVGFAPYVDLLFVDKHTLGLIRQEREARPDRMQVATGSNVVRAANLDAVISVMHEHPYARRTNDRSAT